MMQTAVVDSNILVAIVDQQDKWHIRAKQVVESLIKKDIDLIYFDVIINETISVMARRSEEQKRSDQFTVLLDDLMQRVPEEMITWISWKMQQWYP